MKRSGAPQPPFRITGVVVPAQHVRRATERPDGFVPAQVLNAIRAKSGLKGVGISFRPRRQRCALVCGAFARAYAYARACTRRGEGAGYVVLATSVRQLGRRLSNLAVDR